MDRVFSVGQSSLGPRKRRHVPHGCRSYGRRGNERCISAAGNICSQPVTLFREKDKIYPLPPFPCHTDVARTREGQLMGFFELLVCVRSA